jgi:hypothetical protein
VSRDVSSNLSFCIPCDLRVTLYILVHPGRETLIDALFFVLGWTRHRYHKKRARTRYVKLVSLHPMGSVGHIVYYGVSGA